MTSKHLIDPDLLPALEMIPDFPLSAQGMPQIRAAMQAALPVPAEGLRVDERFIPGPPGAPDVRVLVYEPADAAHSQALRPALLHIHGGGFVMGIPEWNDAPNRARVDLLGCVVVSVDYRLAPEHPHPAPLEDCYAALKWLAGADHGLRVDASRIAITGESAGGGHAAALALLARDRGEVRIAFQLLDCPMIDDRTAARAQALPFVGEFRWTHEKNRFGWSSLLGHEPGGAATQPHAAAARAERLEGLPPTCITVGALDLFFDENVAYATRLVHAGVLVELHVYPGAFHGFSLMADAPVSQRCRRDGLDALRRAFKLPQNPG